MESLTAEDQAVLREMHARGAPVADIHKILGRSLTTIYNAHTDLGLECNKTKRDYRYWTAAEDAILRDYLDQRQDLTEVQSKIPQRPLTSIQSRMRRLRRQAGLKLRPHRAWDSADDAELLSLELRRRKGDGNLTRAGIAEVVGRTAEAVDSRLKKLQKLNRISLRPWREGVSWASRGRSNGRDQAPI